MEESEAGGSLPDEVVKDWGLGEGIDWLLLAKPDSACIQNNGNISIYGSGEHRELHGIYHTELLAWPLPSSIYVHSDAAISSYLDIEATETFAESHVVAFRKQAKIPFRVRYLTPRSGQQRHSINLVAPCARHTGPLSSFLQIDAPIPPVEAASTVFFFCFFALALGSFFSFRELRLYAASLDSYPHHSAHQKE